jgi:hypothetical protein
MTTIKKFAGIFAIGAAASFTMARSAQALTIWDYSFTDDYKGCRLKADGTCDAYCSNRDIIGSF